MASARKIRREATDQAAQRSRGWSRTPESKSSSSQERRSKATLLLGLLGGALCYLAQPPANLRLLAWVGPVPWLLLARQPQLPGRKRYLALWLVGAIHWLATVQWLRLAHPANIAALLFVAAYLGLYLPSFVALTRAATHRLRVPLWLSGPIAWTGLEWLRARLFTGFLMASLAHTQTPFTNVIQIADVLGEYGVTFLIVLVAASIASALPLNWLSDATGHDERHLWNWKRLLALAPGGVALACALAYGNWRLKQLSAGDGATPLRVALVQSNMLSDWKGSPERDAAIMRQQLDLSMRAAQQTNRPLDLIIWPETMFRHRLNTLEAGYTPPNGLFEPSTKDFLNATPKFLASLARDLDAAVLVGIDRTHWRQPPPDQSPGPDGSPPYAYDSYNSAVLVNREGRLAGTYDKMHLLPFGEYIPLSRWLPLLSVVAPVTGSATAGKLPEPLEIDGRIISVNICYETVLPQLIRRQVKHLTDVASVAPQLLVNLTNDAWYWGSSELDMHLASDVFRAIETRTPLVIAANRGLSGHIDSAGRLRRVSQRNRPEALLCDVRLANHASGYPTPYVAWGDWFASACLVSCAVFAVIGWRSQYAAPPS